MPSERGVVAMSLRQAIAALPDSGDGIAAYLLTGGFRGSHYSSHRCPVAAYVRATTGSDDVTAGRERIFATGPGRIWANWPGGMAWTLTPDAVREFMRRFDLGAWPDLVEQLPSPHGSIHPPPSWHPGVADRAVAGRLGQGDQATHPQA